MRSDRPLTIIMEEPLLGFRVEYDSNKLTKRSNRTTSNKSNTNYTNIISHVFSSEIYLLRTLTPCYGKPLLLILWYENSVAALC